MRLQELFKKTTNQINTYVENGNYEVTLDSYKEVIDNTGAARLELVYKFPTGVKRADRFSLDDSKGQSIAEKILAFLFRLTKVTEDYTIDKALDLIIKEQRKFCVAVYQNGDYQNMKLISSLDEKVTATSATSIKDSLKEQLKLEKVEDEDLPF